ncbi:MAG: hypothetical protein RIR26_518 [Pseudomonadota bacterium]|jgi:hypothetical protein
MIRLLSALLLLSLPAFANPPKPSYSDEVPWAAALSDDREVEFDRQMIGDDEVVVDKTFDWMWQTTPSEPMNWYDAYYHCADSRVGGFSDWQLPSYWQIQSIVDHGREQLFVLPVFKKIESHQVLWSRDDHIGIDQPDFDDRWAFHVKIGLTTFEKRQEMFNALCVRGSTPARLGPSGKERFEEVMPDVFLDKVTKLKWTGMRDPKVSKSILFTVVVNQTLASGMCQNHKTGQLSDWRLPTVQELKMILALGKRTISSWMPRMPSSMYSLWTSTPKPGGDWTWGVDMFGQVRSSPSNEPNTFACVHE